MAATLDHLSGGRAILGLGAAWHEEEHRAYGIPFPSPGQRLALLDGACTVIRSLFDDDATTFEGEPDDSRSSTIELTRAGRRLLVAARRTFTDEVGIRLGAALSTSELQRFAATVHRLRAHVHEQRRNA
jgi:alkanesulfonate monooxygenase SsuD/methylene tetrahydromethanopterin reductase-like flavin-dependent oxidoreductase (luciferase family)